MSSRKRAEKAPGMMSASKSLPGGLKLKNKKKVSTFDWTDESIEAAANSAYVPSAEAAGETMETKIARVQERQKEAKERKARLSQTIKPRTESALSRYQSNTDYPSQDHNELAYILNCHFEDYLSDHPDLITPVECKFQLHYFCSSIFNETLPLPLFFQGEAVCLLTNDSPGSSLLHRGLGSWVPCVVLNAVDNTFQITIHTNGTAKTMILDRMYVCLHNFSLPLYGDCILDAITRRRDCVSLMKYYYIISNMPFDLAVTSTLDDGLANKIVQRAMSVHKDVDEERTIVLTEVVDTMIQETRDEFEFCMKKVIFDANMLNRTNISVFRELRVPSSAFLLSQQHYENIETRTEFNYNIKNTIKFFKTNTFLSSKSALVALEGAIKENYKMSSLILFPSAYSKPFALDKFERAMFDTLQIGLRILKQDWSLYTANQIRDSMINNNDQRYDINIRNIRDFESSVNPIKPFMECINFMMSQILTNVMFENLMKLKVFMQSLCSSICRIDSIEQISIIMPQDSVYRTKSLPALFSVSISASEENLLLNGDAVESSKKDYLLWKRSESAAEGNPYPLEVIEPIYGKRFICNHDPFDFKEAVLRAFDNILLELQDVPHVQKFVLDRIFWPQPRFVSTCTEETDWVVEARAQVADAVSSALEPLQAYVLLFQKYDEFLNMDTASYIKSKINVIRKDPDSKELELPVTINLMSVVTVLDYHRSQLKEIESKIPLYPRECGLFQIDVSGVRHMLLGKHSEIMHSILSTHVMHCREVAQYLDDEFRKILKTLAKRPENIEQLTELEEYIQSMSTILPPLQSGILEMMDYNSVHEQFHFKVDLEHTVFKWSVFGMPAKVMQKCTEVIDSNVHIKRRFLEEMHEEQSVFSRSLIEIETEVQSLDAYVDIGEVVFVSDRVRAVEKKLQTALEKSRLFNSREGLFGKDITDYESLNRIMKMFEPYANLWITAKDWTESYEIWTKGRFLDLDADEVEKKVDKFYSAINKAHKYFSKQDMEEQASIASIIKNQVQNFRPEVPMVVTLRNPGMRERHWKAISAQLGVNLFPVEDFTTEQIIALGLKDHLETIQKISESAAKEYQIEQALDKMEKEWTNMMLTISPYRETGTGIIKGVDDINVVLDEQITMTQTVMFSAFKAPFETRIEEWNRKLCLVSDVLEVWVIVQRNWLYLQPIFESPDINRQLPTEGKKFATVDKNWRGAISSAKLNPKVLDYCDNDRLLERFKESEQLLDQVQKGLSDYLETKRSIFARFYFLSNDELLSILSESKDVKRVQPHLKKCFEGIDKVNFLDEFIIDKMISPEGEEVTLTRKIDPVGKNVENWMLELEGLMRISIRDVMKAAIEDYIVTHRTKWMQKWPGMCVLNGSQMHWTKEMEELFVLHGFRGPILMLERQVAQLADMTVLVRGSDIAVSDRFAVFITMNPGYAGRSALPDSLQALFRPVAMMVPDYALIGEIMFFAYGFEHAKECGAKMVTTFKLCSEQLSAQPHYDYGMRAVKTVITAAGNLKRAEPHADEMVLLLRALQDVNIPKFLEMDLPLFEGIIADLFPGRKRPDLDYGALMATMKLEIDRKGLQPVKFFVSKVIQLYEMIVVRHGLMLVGPTGGGKSSNLHILEETLSSLKNQGVKGFAYEHVKIFQLNPKSITMGQMYGEFDPNTMEWQDGIMSTMYRTATVDGPERKWIMFDGPVDAIWIENMNTVLDDNKKLCLNSGEIIKMSNEMTMMFEVEDLNVASPATVSRVGIIYMEPKGLGLDALVQSWLDRMPTAVPNAVKNKLTYLFDLYLQPGISFMRQYCKELVPSIDNNLAESLMRILDCYFSPFVPEEGKEPPSDLAIADMVTCIEALFIFSLIWSVGCTVNEDGRKMFEIFLRQECYASKMSWPIPKLGMVYDYLFNIETKKWTKWMDIIEKFEVDSKQSFSEIIVPTTDSVRNTFLLDTLLSHEKHVLMVGSTGTGKTININQYLMGAAKVQGRVIRSSVIPLTMTFSANTSANLTQDFLDSKMDKRRKGVFGPAAGKKFYIYVDDMNMPKREEYGAQPPIELLRQWFDQGGWYDRKDLSFRKIIDLTFVASMGPAGGGRQDTTPRFLRHFNLIGYVEMSDDSKSLIFGSILKNFLTTFEPGLVGMTDAIVSSSIDIFATIVRELLPTPSKAHYTFNLRDLAKVFQGMLMSDSRRITTKDQLARLWVHESQRVFADRLTCDEDHAWLTGNIRKKVEDVFKMDWSIVMPNSRVVFGDFLNTVSERIYEEIPTMEKLKTIVDDFLQEYNAESKQPMPLVMFDDALVHVARIARILRQPQGNALLLGVGGSGRQSMTKLATYVAGFTIYQVEIIKGYSMHDWRDDLKKVLMQAGVKDKPTTFLFSDVQIINERMVEDINNILNSGDVPNLYAPEDMEAIANACRVECQRRKIPPTKLNIFSQYLVRVRRNIHLCVCMSPIGEAFRNRLRNFPSLVNCCTIDWFTNWPAEALESVGLTILRKKDLGLEQNESTTVEMFKKIHLSVENASKSYYDMLRRRNYVTPTSYLELLSSFSTLIETKRLEILTKTNRLQIGLDKLSETKMGVSVMQEELVVLQPQLVKTQGEVQAMMIQINKDKASAAVTKAQVEVEEAKANEKAAAAKAIADDAQRDLDEAIPALQEAVKCLEDLKKADIDEVRSLKTPPGGVVLTIKVCCLMFEVKPIKKNDPNQPGKKYDDYFEAGQKGLLSDSKVFVTSLFNFDKDNIPDRIIKNIAPFMDDPNFTPVAIERSSKACTAICMWARAMYKYHFVALGVAPKRARLKEAEDELAIVMEQLAIAKAQLQGVNDRIAGLEAAYNDSVAKKDYLEKKEATCKIQLINADKLIGGLGGEESRWTETVLHLKQLYINVLGDVIVSAGTISYLGPFTSDFRVQLVSQWQQGLQAYEIPHTPGCNLESTLSDPVRLRSWQLNSLPNDSLSTQNAIIMDNGRRWPLLIDPQGTGNRYIRSMAKDPLFAPNGIDIVKLSDKNFLRTLENGVQFGRWVLLENILETLDAALEPILLQQKFKQGGQEMMKVGDNVIPYNDSFRFFMTTKLTNPHYAPEVQVKVSLLNFTTTMQGLEEQLLSVVVSEELPDLAEQKAGLVIQNATMNKQLYDIESEILYLLSNSEGNILDDTVLIETLAQSKKTSEEIKEKMKEAENIEEEIVVQSELYRPVAKRASLLYFVITDIGNVDPMYQYSLQWFTQLFIRAINQSTPSAVVDQRIENLNDFFTYSVYINICRSLFERHKLLFSFCLCVKILQGENLIDAAEYRFLLSGICLNREEAPLPASAWLEANVWSDLCDLAGLPAFKGLLSEFEMYIGEWRAVFDNNEPHRMEYPSPCEEITPLQRLCILRCLRRDKIDLSMQDFIVKYLGIRFIQPPSFDLKGCFNDSIPTTPLIFILSSGSDPNKDLDILADDMNMGYRLKRIALGQGQGKKAAALIEKGLVVGDWVMLQNCHLSISWMPILEQICESMEPDKIHRDFRLWLTSMPSDAFPTAVLQNGVKITKEPPKGLRANLMSTYIKLDNDKLRKTDKIGEFQKLLFGLSFYHALVIERKKFGPLGWNIPYEFNDTDMDITAAQLELYVSSYDSIPYKVLQQLTSVVNYGGRITDDKDMRTSDILIADFFNPSILIDQYTFSRSGIYFSLTPDRDAPHQSYLDYIESLPLNAEPEVFGMHDNANITCAITEADTTFEIVLSLQPRITSGTGLSREDQIIALAQHMVQQLPAMYDIEAISMLYPTNYHESMNTVLVQELQRYNRLLMVMHFSLAELQRALKGLVVLSAELESMGNALFDQRVPSLWTEKAYPSLKPSGPWFKDLILRLDFLTTWIDKGIPSSFWISGFFFPQGFLTAILQNYARKYRFPIDTVSFSFSMRHEELEQLRTKPEDGSYIYGLFLEGARWSKPEKSLIDPKAKELFSSMPVLHFLPQKDRLPPTSGIYRCPVYKILTRTGILSTTGHSTNFVTWIEIPSDKSTIWRSSLVSETNAQVKFCDQDYWIKAGVACFCSLRY
eukprot:gene832-1621_t